MVPARSVLVVSLWCGEELPHALNNKVQLENIRKSHTKIEANGHARKDEKACIDFIIRTYTHTCTDWLPT